jgi:hypothetical protein
MPLASTARALRLISSSLSAKYWRRSECPTIT